MADDGTATKGRSSEEIRREIGQTRERMDRTVQALGDRLSPGHIVDRAWHRFRDGDGAVGEVLREHAVPVALMGLGLGWLAVEQATGRSTSGDGRSDDASPGSRARAEGRRGPYRGDAIDHDDPNWEHADTGTRLKAKAGEAASELGEKASGALSSAKHAKERWAEKGSDAGAAVKEEARSAASSIREGARTARQRGQDRFRGAMDENPLAVGAVAFGLGLAAGVSVPSTSMENRLVGRTSETLKDEIGRVARESTGKAKRVARAAAEETGRASELPERTGRAAKETGRAAVEAAEHRAEKEGLTAEGLQEEARKVGERTKEQAKEDARQAAQGNSDREDPR